MNDREELKALADEIETSNHLFTLGTKDMMKVVAALRARAAMAGEKAFPMNDRVELLKCADWLEAGASLAMSAVSKAQGEFAAKSLRELAALRLASQPPSADVVRMREALEVCRQFIRGEQIENAVVCIGSMKTLGELIDEALASHSDGGAKSSDGGRTGAGRPDQLARSGADVGRENGSSQAYNDAGVAPGPSEATPAPADVTYNVGRWLSAALDDPAVCADMKADINAWFAAGMPRSQR